MNLNMNDWTAGILSAEERSALPILSSPGFSLIGKNVLDGVRDGSTQARAVKAIADRYPVAASVMMMDLSVEAEAFGAPVQFHENEIPVVKAPCLDAEKISAGIEIPSLSEKRLPAYLDAARYLSELIRDRPVFAGCIGPFSLAGRLFGMTEIMLEMMVNGETVFSLLDVCTRFLLDYIRAYKAAGINGILVAEPAAGMLSPDMCESFSSTYIKTLVEAVQDEDFLFILHNCGNTGILNRAMADTGAGAIHVGNKNRITETIGEVPGNLLVMGNIDPAGVLKLGTPGTVRTETMRLLESTEGMRNFILSTGCDVPPDTSMENIDAFMDAVREYNSGCRL